MEPKREPKPEHKKPKAKDTTTRTTTAEQKPDAAAAVDAAAAAGAAAQADDNGQSEPDNPQPEIIIKEEKPNVILDEAREDTKKDDKKKDNEADAKNNDGVKEEDDDEGEGDGDENEETEAQDKDEEEGEEDDEGDGEDDEEGENNDEDEQDEDEEPDDDEGEEGEDNEKVEKVEKEANWPPIGGIDPDFRAPEPKSSSGAIKARIAGKVRPNGVDPEELRQRIAKAKQELEKGKPFRLGGGGAGSNNNNNNNKDKVFQRRWDTKHGKAKLKAMEEEANQLEEQQRQRQRQRQEQSSLTNDNSVGSATDDNSGVGATKTMAAHQPFSPEYKKRQEQVLKTIAAKKGKAFAEKVARRWKQVEHSQGNLKLPFKKEVNKQRLAEFVPLVRHAFVISPEEELILDTTLSFVHGLYYGVFSKNAGEALSPSQEQALLDWLDLLSATLPEEWGIHELIESLGMRIKFIARSHDNLKRVIASYKIQRRAWSDSCQRPTTTTPAKGGGGSDASAVGFHCGFWKLLHTMSIGLAQHRGGQTLIDSGMRKPSARVFSPSEAADIVRSYMKNFFLCEPCTDRFIYFYDDCSRNRRCDRLAMDPSTASDDDWKEMGKWLWELHNDFNVAILRDRAKAASKHALTTTTALQHAVATYHVASKVNTIAALWPNMEHCLKCYAEDGSSWNEDAVFLYLELEYWPDQADAKMTRLLHFEEDFYYSSRSGGMGLLAVLLLAGLLLAYSFTQNRIALQKAILTMRTTAAATASGRGVAFAKRSE
ncbi:hypothetical protein ACA910_008411 [Epithemia clementina (nom. ined.)]